MASPPFGRSSILSAGRPGFGSCRSPPNSGVTVMAASSVDAARHRKPVFIALVLLLLAGLPVAAWFDLRHLSETLLRRQASDLNSLISGFRAYYASNVVGACSRRPATPRSSTTMPTFPVRSRFPRPSPSSSGMWSASSSTTSPTASSRTFRSRTGRPMSWTISSAAPLPACGRTRSSSLSTSPGRS